MKRLLFGTIFSLGIGALCASTALAQGPAETRVAPDVRAMSIGARTFATTAGKALTGHGASLHKLVMKPAGFKATLAFDKSRLALNCARIGSDTRLTGAKHKKGPEVVVGTGKTAKEALGAAAQAILPLIVGEGTIRASFVATSNQGARGMFEITTKQRSDLPQQPGSAKVLLTGTMSSVVTPGEPEPTTTYSFGLKKMELFPAL